MKNHCLLALLFFLLFACSLIVSAQDQNCPHFFGAEKESVGGRARWRWMELDGKNITQYRTTTNIC